MDPKQQQQVKQYLNILLRWKKLILGCFLAGLAIAPALFLVIPKTYQAQALLVYQRGQINPNDRPQKAINAREVQEVLATLRDQVLSRSNLEGIIKKFQLYRDALTIEPIEDVIEDMRTKYIEVSSSTESDTFTVAFSGPDPNKVMLVTNALAAKFIEENLRFREEKATETSAYLRDELVMARKALEKKDAAMRDYKLKYYNEMPDQRQTNITRLNALQTNYQDIQNSLQELERTKIMVQEQISIRNAYLAQAAEGNQAIAPLAPNVIAPLGNNNQTARGLAKDMSMIAKTMKPAKTTTGSTAATASDPAQQRRQLTDQLNAARTALASLKTRYTDRYPEVIRLKKNITQLEEQLKALPPAPGTGQHAGGEKQGSAAQPSDPQLVQLDLQLKDINLSIEQLKKEKVEAKRQIDAYQQWIAATPTREAEWADLTRDYDQLNKRYQELVTASLTAASAETLEKRQKGSQFKLVDPANLPQKPYKPNLKKILLVSLFLGLGLGCTLAFGIESVDSSFKEAHDLENYVDLPIVCSVPVIHTESEKKKIFWGKICWAICFFTVFLGIIAGSAYLWKIGLLII